MTCASRGENLQYVNVSQKPETWRSVRFALISRSPKRDWRKLLEKSIEPHRRRIRPIHLSETIINGSPFRALSANNMIRAAAYREFSLFLSLTLTLSLPQENNRVKGNEGTSFIGPVSRFRASSSFYSYTRLPSRRMR